MQVFKYYNKSMFRGFVISETLNNAKAKLKRLSARFTKIEYSYFDTLKLKSSKNMNEVQRASMYRAVSSRLKSGQDMQTSIRSVILASQELPTIYVCDRILEYLSSGKKISYAFRLAGLPEEDIGHIENGEKSGSLTEAFNELQGRLYDSIKLKKQIKGDIIKPLIAFVAIWLLFFPAFSIFIPLIYDNVIEPNDTLDQLSPFYINFILFCLFLRDTMPFSMIIYYSLPFLIYYGVKYLGISRSDMANIFPPIKNYIIALDVMSATQIISQKTKSDVTVEDAARSAISSMRTGIMRAGLNQFCNSIKRGRSVVDSINDTVLPVVFINEVNNAAESKSFGNTLEEFIPLASITVTEKGEVMKLFVTLVVLVMVSIGIIMLVSLTYIPVLKSTLQLAG